MYITDINKDGLPDIVYSAYNSSQHKDYLYHCINEGDKVLSVETFENRSFSDGKYYLDFNHDGHMDYNTGSRTEINLGNDMDFAPVEIGYVGSYMSYEMPFITDLNKDGFYDGVSNYFKSDANVEVYINNGDGTITRQQIPITDTSHFADKERFTISAVADMNNDGYSDLIIQKNAQSILIALNNKNETFDEVKEIILPMDLYKVEIGNIFDFDNNGFLDIALYSSQNASILYFYNDLETKMMNFGDNRYNYDGIGRYKAALEIDLNGDGIPDFIDTDYGNYTYFRNNTSITNTHPEKPTNIRSNQTEKFVTLQWDAAKDAETPYTQMRYNISVKKQGSTGAGAFILLQ